MRTMKSTRRLISTIAVLSAAIGMTTIGATAHATSSIGGSITSDEMMTRAQSWVDNKVPYDQTSYAADPEGTTYREDCSGFVSMAWHLNTSLVVTDGGPAFTTTDGSPNSTYDSGIGSFSNLQPGDAMAYPHDHIWLFDNWVNKANGDFTYYAESNPSDPTHGPTQANINSISLEGWPTSGYVGLRYNKISAPASAPPQQFVGPDRRGGGRVHDGVEGHGRQPVVGHRQRRVDLGEGRAVAARRRPGDDPLDRDVVRRVLGHRVAGQ